MDGFLGEFQCFSRSFLKEIGVLVGTKNEITKKAVKTADGHALAKKLGLDYFETSSVFLLLCLFK